MDYYNCLYCCKICEFHLSLFQIRRDTHIVVKPALQSPHRVLTLLTGDVITARRSFERFSHLIFFQADLEITGTNFVQKMRHALEHLLVLYYPLAGRLRVTEHGKLEAVCNGEGAVFVEAYANTTLDDFKQLDKNYRSELYHDIHAENPKDVPALVVQVTHFACGSFALGITVYETLCDINGIPHFLHCWKEIVQGKKVVSVIPVWERETISAESRPLKIHFPSFHVIHDHEKFLPYHEMQKPEAFVPMIHIELSFQAGASLLKLLLRERLSKCTVFEALAAHVWRERTRSLDIPHTKDVKLFFLADISSKEHGHIPEAFYGNYAFNCEVTTTAGKLVDSPLIYAVELIQSAKAKLKENFPRAAIDFVDLHCPGGWSPSRVLLFAHEQVTHCHLELGGMKEAHLDGIPYYPPNLNVASIGHGPNGSDLLHITVQNVLHGSTERLKRCLRDGPSQPKIESRL